MGVGPFPLFQRLREGGVCKGGSVGQICRELCANLRKIAGISIRTKMYSLELTDGLPRHGPSDWDKVTKDERSVFQFCHLNLEQNTHSHEDKDGLLEAQRSDLRQRCRAGIRNFLDNLSGQEVYSPKPANGLSKRP